MRTLSLRQPTAGAVLTGLQDTISLRKLADVRPRQWLMVHASQSMNLSAIPEVEAITGQPVPPFGPRSGVAWEVGAILGSVFVTAVHRCNKECGPWVRRGEYHVKVIRPSVLREAVPCAGRPGVWWPDGDVIRAIKSQRLVVDD